ncbi:MAG: SGNH/GDSL hydrolase family protein [Clostridia bacterium]|nr:SGNH/GDSL hydrolase family protein [Clostridia bacterium]
MAKKVIVWGDSVAKGVVYDEARGRYVLSPTTAAAIAGERLGLEIVNRSRMGATVSEGERMMSADLARGLTGDMAIIEYGGNDCDFDWRAVSEAPDAVHDPKTPAPLFETKLRGMIATVADAGIEPMLVTLPPIVAGRYFDFISRGGLDASNILRWLGDKDHIYRYHERYSALIARIARDCGCRLLDLRGEFLALWNSERLFCFDGIHPNEEGQRFMGEAIVRAIG